jgi:hypothetical protein
MSRRLFSLLTWQSTKVPIKIRWEQHPGSFVPRLSRAVFFPRECLARGAKRRNSIKKRLASGKFASHHCLTHIAWQRWRACTLWSSWKSASHNCLICQEQQTLCMGQPATRKLGCMRSFILIVCQINTLTAIMTRKFCSPCSKVAFKFEKTKECCLFFFFCIPALFV